MPVVNGGIEGYSWLKGGWEPSLGSTVIIIHHPVITNVEREEKGWGWWWGKVLHRLKKRIFHLIQDRKNGDRTYVHIKTLTSEQAFPKYKGKKKVKLIYMFFFK